MSYERKAMGYNGTKPWTNVPAGRPFRGVYAIPAYQRRRRSGLGAEQQAVWSGITLGPPTTVGPCGWAGQELQHLHDGTSVCTGLSEVQLAQRCPPGYAVERYRSCPPPAPQTAEASLRARGCNVIGSTPGQEIGPAGQCTERVSCCPSARPPVPMRVVPGVTPIRRVTQPWYLHPLVWVGGGALGGYALIRMLRKR